jgi:hypothetical protein
MELANIGRPVTIRSRKLNIALTQLRCFASFLNYDLYQVNIVSDPSCRCDGVCGCSFGEPLKQETFQTSLYIQRRA